MKKLKIIYIITLSDLGGAQVHLYELISKLPCHITAYLIVGKEGWLTYELQYMCDRIYIIKTLVREVSIKKDIKAVCAIKKIVDDVQPNIIHCHSSKAGVIGRIVSKLSKTPVIFTAHGWAFTDGVPIIKKLIYRYVERMMAQWSDKIFCVSEYDRSLAIKAMPESTLKFITIHNGISNIDIPVKQADEKDAETLRVVMIARFSSQKDQVLLIDAIRELDLESSVNIRLTLVGDGPQFESVKLHADRGTFKNKIQFLGARTDIVDILSQNDIFALISNWEGFPISILEAMRQGMPVLASDVGGVKEAVVDGETGYLVLRGDKECIKEKIRKIYDNKIIIKKMGCNSRKRFLELFSSHIMMKKIIDEYNKINRK